jgi:hypothetical protein
MQDTSLPPGRARHGGARADARATLALALWLPLALSLLGWPGGLDRRALGARRYVLPLAPLTLASPPPGWLGEPINFGARCTLVDAAAVLVFYGARATQWDLAVRLSAATDYRDARGGPPWWAYVAVPGRRPLLDVAIERVARGAGIAVTSRTSTGLDFVRAIDAIARGHPVILNVWRAPNGLYSHSLLAYGYNTRGGRTLLLAIDPDTQASSWVGSHTYWSGTVTSTFIAPVGSNPRA